MKTSIALAAALLTAVSTGAMAADLPNMNEPMSMDISSPDALAWYASAKVGVALPGEINTRSSGAVAGYDGKAKFKAGIEASIAVGKYFTENWRGEIEAAYARNEAESFSGTKTQLGVTTPLNGAMTGNITRYTVSALVYYDFTQFGAFVPYLGAGIGASHLSANNLAVSPASGGAGSNNGEATVPVAQVAVGFNYDVSENFAIGLEYNAQIGSEAQSTYSIPAFGVSQPAYSSVMSHALSGSLTAKF